ncbi:hypothetical protein B0H13DRAFT_1141019 [Mycena leptocephala]|nr:hypothetical protein B0H13DRAFT_1141019 [Mycena leptocephala]
MEEQLPSSVQAEQPAQSGVDAVGGTGGAGLGPVWDAPAVPVDNSSRILLPRIETVVFCNNYDLDDEICKLLTDQEYDSVNSLFEEDEAKLLKELHLKVGHIAELKWALKTMLLLEYPEIKVTDTKGEYAPRVYGGKGGAGGHGGKKGGHGGTGNAPRIGIENLSRFTVISGGVGGAGGTSGVQDQRHRAGWNCRRARGGYHGSRSYCPRYCTFFIWGCIRHIEISGGKGEAGGRGVS